MSFLNKTKKIKTIWIVIATFSVALILLSFFYFKIEVGNEKLMGVFSGLITGLVVALLQLILSYYEYEKIEKLKSMKIIKINEDRDSEDYYRELIKNAVYNIDIMGVTMDRLIDDFADLESPREEKKVLINAINRNVKVRFLLPKREFLSFKNSTKFDTVKEKLTGLKIDYKYFDHYPAHSIFLVDDTCIIGPVFQELQSKDTPAIHFKRSSPFVKKYLEHFDYEWSNAQN